MPLAQRTLRRRGCCLREQRATRPRTFPEPFTRVNGLYWIAYAALLAARFRDGELLWRVLSMFARERFLNTSLISCHNPGLRIYNLDATFSLPAVLMKMLIHSEVGRLILLPALPAGKLP